MKIPLVTNSRKRWPEGAVVYQIYPRSFYDTNGDGVGDIPGITAKLPYLKDLGINVIWLSPFYPSPMADFGYDVADYCGVDPIFGGLKDMDALIKAAHSRSIKILIDLVPNHSSDEHIWFQQSRQSREGTYADWYIWRDAKGTDKNAKPIPPNNWLNIFTGETAWQWEQQRQQFYLHSFDVKQPDLNWANPDVREAIKAAMRFWLDKGVDGFRVDAVRFMGKDPEFKDNPINPDYEPGIWSKYNSIKHLNSQGWPELYEYLAEMAAVLREKPYQKSLRFMVTESYPETQEPIKEYLAFYENVDPEVAAPFNFEGLSLSWEAEPWSRFLANFHDALDKFSPLCVASYAFGNHDQSRLATRLGVPAARSAAVLLLTLPGMSFIYNGEEIGMENAKIPAGLAKDPAAKDGSGRDPERTPLQWSSEKNAGFTTAKTPWLPIHKDYIKRNIQKQLKDPSSYYWLYRNLCNLRNTSAALKTGAFEIIETGHQSVVGYVRSKNRDHYLVLINYSEELADVKLPNSIKISHFYISSDAESNHKKTKDNLVYLLPYEAVVMSLTRI